MKVSKLIGLLLILALTVGGWVGAYIYKQNTKPKVGQGVVTPPPAPSFTDSEESEEDEETDSTEKEDKEQTDENTSDTEVTGDKTSKDIYVLISGLPPSYDLQDVLIGLYNLSSQEITYFPYDYYIWEFNGKKNVSLGNLDPSQLKNYFVSQGVQIKDQVIVDSEMVADLFTKVMSGKDYELTWLNEKNQKVKIVVKTSPHLFNIMAKDNLNRFVVLEQLHNQLIKLLVENNEDVKKKLAGLDPETLTSENLYDREKLLSITGKNFQKKQIWGKFFSVDEESKYFNAFLESDLTPYLDTLPAIVETTVNLVDEKEKVEDENKTEDAIPDASEETTTSETTTENETKTEDWSDSETSTSTSNSSDTTTVTEDKKIETPKTETTAERIKRMREEAAKKSATTTTGTGTTVSTSTGTTLPSTTSGTGTTLSTSTGSTVK